MALTLTSHWKELKDKTCAEVLESWVARQKRQTSETPAEWIAR